MVDMDRVQSQIAALEAHVRWLLLQHFRSLPDPVAAATGRKAELEELGQALMAKHADDADRLAFCMEMATDLPALIDDVLAEMHGG